MKESSTLNDLTQKLKDKKSKELQQRQAIEQENLKELATSLKTSLTEELNSIKESIYEVQKFVNTKNNTLAKNAEENAQEITESFKQVSQELTKLRAKQWIIPTVIGVSIVIGLTIGSYLLGNYVDRQLDTLNEIDQETKISKQNKKQIGENWGKVYNNAIVLKPNITAEIGTTESGQRAIFFKVGE